MQKDFTILVVDDEPAIVEVTVTILNAAGFLAVGTVDPKEALRWIETQPTINVLLSDVMMESTTGPELVRRAQKIRNGDLRVLFMSGGFDGVRVRETDRVLSKPWTSAELLHAVGELLVEVPLPARRQSAA